MSEQQWLVIRCQACQQCSGQRRQGGRCPHCGSSMGADAEVVKVCDSSATLHLEVALANTPPELREELRSRLSTTDLGGHEQRYVSPRSLLRELRTLADERGEISLDSVQQFLSKKEVDIPAEAFMEQAELEGVLLRLTEGHWMFFE